MKASRADSVDGEANASGQGSDVELHVIGIADQHRGKKRSARLAGKNHGRSRDGSAEPQQADHGARRSRHNSRRSGAA